MKWFVNELNLVQRLQWAGCAQIGLLGNKAIGKASQVEVWYEQESIFEQVFL